MSVAKIRRRRYTDAADAELTALGYRRVSKTEMARDGGSFARQLEENRAEIARHASDGWIAGEEFEDVESGRKDARHGYQALLNAARAYAAKRQRCVIVIVAFDRLGRNLAERVRCWQELTALGHEIYSIRQGGVVAEFIYNIYASIAQEESRGIGERQWGIIQGYEEHGWHKPGSAPWGYTWRERTPDEQAAGAPKSVLIVHDDEATAVQAAWRMRADGQSYHRIALWANGLPHHERGGRNLGYAAIRAMFKRAVYVGRHGWADDDERGDVLGRPSGNWTPLVDDDVWRLCRARDDEHDKMPRQARGEYLLTGLLRCAACGNRMSGRPRRQIREYFCCSSLIGQKGRGEQLCYATVETTAIEAPVEVAITELLAVASDPRARELVRRAQVLREKRARRDDPIARRARIEQELEKIADGVKKASAAWLKGDLDDEGYHGGRAELMAERERLQAELSTLGPSREPVASVADDSVALMSGLHGWRVAWEAGDPAGRRSLLAVLVDEVRPVRYARGKYYAAIAYSAIGRAALTLRQALAELEGDDGFMAGRVASSGAPDVVVGVSGVGDGARATWLTPGTTIATIAV